MDVSIGTVWIMVPKSISICIGGISGTATQGGNRMKQKYNRKCKYFLILCLMLFLFRGTAYASAGLEDSGGTDSFTITDENRFDPKFYQQPEERYPASSTLQGRSARSNVDLETYLVHALEQFQTSIDVAEYGISREKAAETYFQVLNSHPELFYVEGYVEWNYNSSGVVTKYKSISYRDTQANIKRQQQELEAAAEQALAWVDPSMADVEKALILHDYLVLNCAYDEERRQNGTVPSYSHSAYGALVSGLAVCDGYSHAYAYLLENKLGIPCELVTSNSMNHAWSMVSIDGEWYHVDVTWDDPIWDCIGRVKHDYFLISDTVISDSSHKHGNWSAGHKATSNTYRNAFWKQVSSGFCYQGGDWYYAKYGGSAHGVDLVKKESLLGTEETIIFTEPELWNQYRDSYMYLDLEPKSKKIYFNTRTSICRLELDGTVRTVYEPALSGNQLIFGFTIKGEQVRYWLQGTPNLQGKQNISFVPLSEVQLPEPEGENPKEDEEGPDGEEKDPEGEGNQPEGEGNKPEGESPEGDGNNPEGENPEGEVKDPEGENPDGEVKDPEGENPEGEGNQPEEENPEGEGNNPEGDGFTTEGNSSPLEGISAQNIKTPYDGTPKKIAISGAQPSDKISYAGANGAYGSEQPVMVNAGTYQVKYKVERAGYTPFLGKAMVEIEKAAPSYVLPTGLNGSSGMAVKDIPLPAGFVWQTASGTYLKKEGIFKFHVKFVPEDTKNYREAKNLPVDVTVSCPGHQYTKKTTREATSARKGLETYTCKICGHIVTKEVALPTSEKPGKVSGLKLEKSSSATLKFSWKKTNGISYRLVLYKKNKIVDAKDTSAGSGTFTGLQPSTAYTLKVRPYQKQGGRRIYGDVDGSLKATTAPAKAKLLSVKKKGTSKARLTWKKVPGADGYEISMRTGTGSYKAIKTIAKGNTSTYTKAGLKKGKSYRFRVRAYRKSGKKKVYGDYSNVKRFVL